MPTLRYSMLALAVLGIAACTPKPVTPVAVVVPPPPPAPVLGPDACGASRLGGYIGAVPRGDIKPNILATVGERPIRFLAPGDVATMDYSPARLTVDIAQDGRIRRFRCG
jgi:hypothetical protein